MLQKMPSFGQFLIFELSESFSERCVLFVERATTAVDFEVGKIKHTVRHSKPENPRVVRVPRKEKREGYSVKMESHAEYLVLGEIFGIISLIMRVS